MRRRAAEVPGDQEMRNEPEPGRDAMTATLAIIRHLPFSVRATFVAGSDRTTRASPEQGDRSSRSVESDSDGRVDTGDQEQVTVNCGFWFAVPLSFG